MPNFGGSFYSNMADPEWSNLQTKTSISLTFLFWANLLKWKTGIYLSKMILNLATQMNWKCSMTWRKKVSICLIHFIMIHLWSCHLNISEILKGSLQSLAQSLPGKFSFECFPNGEINLFVILCFSRKTTQRLFLFTAEFRNKCRLYGKKNPALPSLTTAYTKFYQDFKNKSSFSFNVRNLWNLKNLRVLLWLPF